MLTLVNSLPWHLWVILGILGSIYIVSWVIKSTQNDPILWRIGWLLLGGALGGIVTIDNLIKGHMIYVYWWSMVMERVLLVVLLSVVLIYIGGYQKIMRPGYDSKKRRLAIRYLLFLVGIFIIMGFGWAGFYIYDNFFK